MQKNAIYAAEKAPECQHKPDFSIFAFNVFEIGHRV